jgi:large subunit ribosomal protein L46
LAKGQIDLNNQFSQLKVEEREGLLDPAPEDTDSFGSHEVLEENSLAEAKRKAKKGLLIPRGDFQFWKIYGNRLRVFGSEERVCHIG